MTTCPKCGMGYIQGLPEDEKRHKPYHDRIVNGVPARPLKTDQVIWQASDQRITVVTAHSPISQRKRAEAVASAANVEYDCGIYHAAETPDERDAHLFLYHTRNRIIGVVILEKQKTVWRCRWRGDNKPECEELLGHDPMWSVVFIWVHAKNRNHGGASHLLTEGLKYLGQSQQTVGWYTPFTDSGRAFAKSICPDEFYIAK